MEIVKPVEGYRVSISIHLVTNQRNLGIVKQPVRKAWYASRYGLLPDLLLKEEPKVHEYPTKQQPTTTNK